MNRAPNILIAEDEEIIRILLKEIMSPYGNLLIVSDGRQALETVKDTPIDLVLTDVMMPNMDGITFLKELGFTESTAPLPTVILTAVSLKGDLMEFYRPGFVEYLRKPFDPDSLRQAVEQLLDFKKEREQSEGTSTLNQNFLSKLHLIINEQISNSNYHVPELSREIGVSERQLFRITKSTTGLTPAAFLKEVRLQKGKYLLENRHTHNVLETMKAVGYTSQAHFGKAMKHRFGINPSKL
ncbi:MAG: response regulator [Cyclobacteriaceae bacterium]